MAFLGMVIAGCSTTSAPMPSPPKVGVVTGVASPCWPYPTNKGIEKSPVRVVATRDGKTLATQTVRGDHVYRFTLGPGSYVVTTFYSRPRPVTIASGRTVKVDLPDDCL